MAGAAQALAGLAELITKRPILAGTALFAAFSDDIVRAGKEAAGVIPEVRTAWADADKQGEATLTSYNMEINMRDNRIKQLEGLYQQEFAWSIAVKNINNFAKVLGIDLFELFGIEEPPTILEYTADRLGIPFDPDVPGDQLLISDINLRYGLNGIPQLLRSIPESVRYDMAVSQVGAEQAARIFNPDGSLINDPDQPTGEMVSDAAGSVLDGATNLVTDNPGTTAAVAATAGGLYLANRMKGKGGSAPLDLKNATTSPGATPWGKPDASLRSSNSKSGLLRRIFGKTRLGRVLGSVAVIGTAVGLGTMSSSASANDGTDPDTTDVVLDEATKIVPFADAVRQTVEAGTVTRGAVESAASSGGFLAGATAGAAAGAALGSVIPGAGTLVGGTLGFAFGLAGGVIGEATAGWAAEKLTSAFNDNNAPGDRRDYVLALNTRSPAFAIG